MVTIHCIIICHVHTATVGAAEVAAAEAAAAAAAAVHSSNQHTKYTKATSKLMRVAMQLIMFSSA
jgi:hypothetical protein